MIEMFSASSVVGQLEHNGIVYKDVEFDWFVYRPFESLRVPAEHLPPLEVPEDCDYRQSVIDECFTVEELVLFQSWHQKHYGRDATIKKVQFPLLENVAGYSVFGAGGSEEIVDYSEGSARDLPFRLNAHYDVRGCYTAPGSSPAVDAILDKDRTLSESWSIPGWKVKVDCNEYYDSVVMLCAIMGNDVCESILDGKVKLTHDEVVTFAEKAIRAPEAFEDLGDIIKVGNTELLKCLVFND